MLLTSIVGCGPLKAASDIFSADMPTKSSGRTVNHFSTGDPDMLNAKSHPHSDSEGND
ncbi:MAG TPA: hypothetical protein VHU84_19885 [Lacipirellulaceae bacterium]|jgi:hypothetical protein|nr:hypothetical protein [Lacipirellulaceae bacterium]